MTTKNFFIVSAIVAFLFGIGLLLVPATIIGPYMTDTTVSASMEALGRAYGTSLLGLAFMFWMARNAHLSIARKAIIMGVVVADALVGLVHIYGIFNGVEQPLAWGTVALVFLLAIWGGICLSREKLPSDQ